METKNLNDVLNKIEVINEENGNWSTSLLYSIYSQSLKSVHFTYIMYYDSVFVD
jgi:hypothetical protein